MDSITLSGVLEAGAWALTLIFGIYSWISRGQYKTKVGQLYVVADAVMYGIKQGLTRFGEGKALEETIKRAERSGVKADVRDLAIEVGHYVNRRKQILPYTNNGTAAAKVADN